MAQYNIKQGRNIKIKGSAEKRVVAAALPKLVALVCEDLRGWLPKVLVAPGAVVKAGTPVVMDKNNEAIKLVAPVSGTVRAVNRGEKRALTNIVIEPDNSDAAEKFTRYQFSDLPGLSRAAVVTQLLAGGLWPCLRQRPFSRLADPALVPKAIFVHAMNTEPLAADVDFVLEGREKDFQAGLDIIRKLSPGQTHLCIDSRARSAALTGAAGVELQRFSGAHPAGNVSTHIHCVDPVNKGEVVWYIEAQDVLRVAALFLRGVHSAERMVAVTGEGARERVYFKTVSGAPVASLLAGSNLAGQRCISGSILAGRNVGPEGFLGFYDSQVTVLPEGGKRELFGWMMPGFNKYTFTSTYMSAFLPRTENTLDTDTHGALRAIVWPALYDDYVALDLMTFFLVRAIIVGDIEEMISLGILECDEEDFALCSFACPSKVDVGGYIRQGLDLVEAEG
ncbi:MAG: Na(+)-translocating NADH-quinone reductase subunit A [Candidatus Omnitrophica bacterium]|nr:Na(+)-translocating NADH-quinone reductase subunit A [Candidatus Omnitrophota bacterium]